MPVQVDHGYRCPIKSKTKMCVHHEDDPPAQVCHGDSGGPLIVDEEGFGLVVGVASRIQIPKCKFGDWKCMKDVKCDSKATAIYTNVLPFLTWIKEHTGTGEGNYKNNELCCSSANQENK